MWVDVGNVGDLEKKGPDPFVHSFCAANGTQNGPNKPLD